MKSRFVVILAVLAFIGMARWAVVFHANAQVDRSPAGNGDTNGDGVRDLSDAVYHLNWLFNGGPEPVAIAGSPEIEARLRAVEDQLAEIEMNGPPRSALDLALESLRRLGGDASSEVWNQPLRKFHDTGPGGAAPGRATLSFKGEAAPGRVMAFQVVEGMSVPTRIDIVEEIPIPSYQAVSVGTPLQLSYVDATGQAIFHGEVASVTLAGRSETSVHVITRGFSRLHRLTRGRKSRVFQNMNSVEIALRILADAGIPKADLELVIEQTPPRRDYVFQYNESDFDFVSRLLQEDGVYYFELHADGAARIRLGDGLAGRVAADSAPLTYPGHLATPKGEAGFFAFELRRNSSLPFATVAVGDYDPVTATTLFGTATSALGLGEDYHFGLSSFDRARMNTIARRELELSQAAADSIEGESHVTFLRPGSLVTIQDAQAAFNGKYLVTGVTHRFVTSKGPNGSQSYFGNSFQALPEALRFRPARVTPKPACPGVQSAFVTGPAGQTTHTDDLGRVKVRFPWLRDGATDETSSAWVRVAQNGLGTGTRGYFLPEIGDEVLVAFEHGDINRPIIIGALWNGSDKPPR